MAKIVTIAVSMTVEELERIERERVQRGQSRSEFIRDAVRATLKRWEDEAAVAAYIESYRKHPETEEEMQMAREVAARALSDDEDWE